MQKVGIELKKHFSLGVKTKEGQELSNPVGGGEKKWS